MDSVESPIEGTFTTRDGTELFTVTVSDQDPRYELLHVHGLGEHSGRWIQRFTELAKRGARVTAFDLRGHGRSGGERMHVDSFDQFTSDVSEIATATSASTGRPWVLYGHSMGGLIATSYLINACKPVPNIAVLSAPALGDGTPAAKRFAAKLIGAIAPKIMIKTPIAGEQLSRDPKVGEAYFDDPLVQQMGTVGLGRVVFAEQARLAPDTGRITIPTLVIHGADDTLVPTAASASLAKSVSVERKVYPGLRHELHFEPEGAHVIGDVGDWIEGKLF
ncbi:MAG: lysophospholipase [Acidimicrobiia bacterium]|nr:lysophospholipase [Acidimicrobiia bacterium]